MWAILLQVLAVAAGWQIVRQLPLSWRYLEAAAASVAVGFAVTPWLYFLGAWAFGWSIAMPLVTALLAAGTALSWWRLRTHAKLTPEPHSHRRWVRIGAWVVATAVVLLVSHLVILSYQFPAADGSWISNGNVWGDGPLHVALTNQFAYGDKLDLVSPVYQQTTLTYPLMADLWSGVLLRVNGDWFWSLTAPSLIMILALLQLLFSFAYRLIGSLRGAWMAWLMIVFSGSVQGGLALGGVLLFQGYQAYTAKVGTSIAFAMGDNYLNFLHSHPLPQRSYGFGMALALVIGMVLLHMYRSRADAKPQPWHYTSLLAGLMLGLLPLIHTHSFMVMAGILILATTAMLAFNRKLPPGWPGMLVTGLVIAAPQIIWQFQSSYHSGFTRWIFGWVMKDFAPSNQVWLIYWAGCIGWLLVVMLVGWWWLRRGKARAEVWLMYVAGVSIFAICNVYVFQPSYWDNMKFFEYGFWMIMLVAAAIFSWWSRHLWGKVLIAIVLFVMCLPGVLTLVASGSALTFQLLSKPEVAFGERMAITLPQDAYILVGDRHNHPITMLARRKVLMTFSGWYNLYDGDWPTTLADRGKMLGGSTDAPGLINQYNLGFAAFSDYEVANGEANLSFFESTYPLFYRGEGWWVFDLRPAE